LFQCIRPIVDERKQAPIVDLNYEMVSLSSSSSSTSSLYTSKNGCSSVNILRPNCMLQSLSEYMSPSLSKTIFSSSTITDDKTATLTPFNNRSTESNYISNTSFTGKM
jgi:hypothetical protein